MTDHQADPAEAEAVEELLPEPTDDRHREEPESQAEEPRPRKGVDARIGELTKARRDAEREAADLRRQLAERQAPSDEEPKPEDFESDRDFIKAQARHEARQVVHEEQTERLKARESATAQARTESWIEEGRTKHPDFDDVVLKGAANNTWVCTAEMRDAMYDSDVGSDVAMHLAKNPDEARRIAALSPTAQVREIVKLESRLSAEEPEPARVSKAPPPPQSGVRGSQPLTGRDFQLERLEAEAARTGDRSAVIAHQRAKRRGS